MSVEHVEVLVEERSMAVALEAILPKLLGPISFAVRDFQGKPDLVAKLPQRLRGYAKAASPGLRIVVLVDRDRDDCDDLKAQLEGMAAAAGLRTRTALRSKRGGGAWMIVNRIAVEELEAWYFGDWAAVRAAFPRVSANVPRQAPYRNPDAIKGGTAEAFERVLRNAGYFDEGLSKIRAARAVAQRLDPAANTSRSFQVFRDAILELAAA